MNSAMTDRTPAAFMISLTLHGVIVAILLFFTYAVNRQIKEAPKVFVLVQGDGDNYGATVAPALGTPGGVKVNVPAPPAPKVETPAKTEPAPMPAKPEAIPVTPPPPKAATPKAPTQRTPAQEIRRQLANADLRAKREVAKERADEEKRAALAAKSNPPATPPKYTPIDGEGIAKGVLNGSTDNKVGGANGKALSREDGPVMDAYFSMLKDRVRKNVENLSGLGETLVVEVAVTIAVDGSLSGARVTKTSGSPEFDRAVIAAFGRFKMPEHPQHKSEQVKMTFRTKDAEER